MEQETINNTIISHLHSGYGLCHGIADSITESQSGGRELRRLVEADPEKYKYFKAKGKKKGVYYKVFFVSKKLPEKNVSIKHDLKADEWYVSAILTPFDLVESKRFKTKKEALESIKRCSKKEVK